MEAAAGGRGAHQRPDAQRRPERVARRRHRAVHEHELRLVEAGVDEVVSIAREAYKRSECIFMLETLEYLEKGGRIGKAKALLGSLLRIRPMLRIDGVVHELGKERSRQRGISRLQEIARGFSPIDELAVIHSTTLDDALAVSQNLSDLLPECKEPIVARVGPVIGTYTGPGVVGIGVLRSAGRK